MAELHLTGTSAGTILQANNNITSNQTFTFPDSGGELVTTNAPGGGQVVGYQSGTIVPDLRRWNSTDGVVEVPSSMQTPTRRSGRYTRIGDLVTYAFDWAGTIEWGVVNGQSWKGNNDLVITAPYANTSNPFIQTNGVYRAWQTQIPQGPDTFCSGVLSVVKSGNGLVTFEEVRNNGGQTLSGTWELWRGSQTSGGVFEVQVSLTYFTDDTTWQPLFGATVS